jgi:hypothetical protein
LLFPAARQRRRYEAAYARWTEAYNALPDELPPELSPSDAAACARLAVSMFGLQRASAELHRALDVRLRCSAVAAGLAGLWLVYAIANATVRLYVLFSGCAK